MLYYNITSIIRFSFIVLFYIFFILFYHCCATYESNCPSFRFLFYCHKKILPLYINIPSPANPSPPSLRQILLLEPFLNMVNENTVPIFSIGNRRFKQLYNFPNWRMKISLPTLPPSHLHTYYTVMFIYRQTDIHDKVDNIHKRQTRQKNNQTNINWYRA